ncbi:glycoside hydrolase family 2 protein [Asticcacaulis sp. 201]|uniref:glycoside hydrolase family 2 protein n=1 Tax=Asticcacaulis sp. 201 TaxID=3028787 RepID=UPI00291673E0|nr:glycoside hydrolase family 2 TIM barrel-domain containing protein [Asticcacaulis sp. 201]MDV6330392.1 glycoside hydrolase family 2 TIM barrel-domain containing protein [Asticcacaulis sp. 201]
MKPFALILGLALLALPAAASEQRSLNANWLFIKADVPAARQVDFHANSWQPVDLPHTFNAGDANQGGDKSRGEPEGVYYRGPAWYRHQLTLTPEAGKHYILQFDGAALTTDVYVNGESIGRHEGGYARFRFDITQALKAGDNLIAVRVDNSRAPQIAPLTGDFNIFGGLYRNVSLITTGGVHIDLMDHGGPGVYVTTRTISTAKADIAARVLLRNETAKTAKVQVRTRIVDADGKTVATATTSRTLAPASRETVEQALKVSRPRLWAGRKDPYLYTVVVDAGDDSVTVPLGIRTVTVTRDKGFLLNGQPYAAYGANMQQPVRKGRGTAVSDADIDEDMTLMNEMGVTALRLAHMQHPQRVYDDADRMGILITTEAPLVDEISAGQAFQDNAVQQMRELIAQNYNHPSVALWGLGNEIRHLEPDPNPVLAALQSTAKEMDPSRLTVYAHCCLADDDAVANHSDVTSYNRYFGWYGNSFADMGKWADELHAKYPDRIFGVSEYGAGASILHQEDPPKAVIPQAYWHPEQYQALYHEANWNILKSRPYLWSNFIWVAIDFPSFRRNEGDRPAINDKGLITEDRKTKKDAYYWYQANWAEKRMIHITSPRDTNKRVRHVTVKVYSNMDEVRLSLNGHPLGAKPVTDHIATWDIDLRDGENVIEAFAGKDLHDRVTWVYAGAQ